MVALALFAAACGDDTPTSPSTNPPTTVAPASISETYTGTLVVGGSRFYSFTVHQNGTVNVSLASLGDEIPSDVAVELVLGQPAGTGCAPKTTVSVSIESAVPHITGSFPPGVYCARITDTGTLPSTAQFVVAIEHS
jgi:hypothetical protein